MVEQGLVRTDERVTQLEQRLEQLVSRLERTVAQADWATAQAAPAIATMVDTFDSVVMRLQAKGIDPEERIGSMLHAADQMTKPATMAALDAVLTSGLLDPNALAVVGRLGSALATVGGTPAAPVGMFGLLKALRDPDIQRALGLLLAVARQVGANLPTEQHALAAGGNHGGQP